MSAVLTDSTKWKSGVETSSPSATPRAGLVPDTEAMCIGEVFQEDERLAYCESIDKDSARQYCRQIVDTRIAQLSAGPSGLPPDQAILVHALHSIEKQLDPRLRHVLQAHWQQQNQAVSIETLKQTGAFDSTTAVYLAFAELARLLCDAMRLMPVTPRSGQDPYLNMIIETLEPDLHSSDSLSLRLRPAIHSALEQFFSA